LTATPTTAQQNAQNKINNQPAAIVVKAANACRWSNGTASRMRSSKKALLATYA